MKKVARLRLAADEHLVGGGAGEQIGVRTTGRIKKPKAVFDPSDNYLPRSQRLSTTTATHQQQQQLLQQPSSTAAVAIGSGSSERKRDVELINNKRLSLSSGHSICTTVSLTSPVLPVETCIVCSKREPKRGLGAKNKLIACTECDVKVHKMCLKVDFEDTDILRANFKCENCRSCNLCSAFSEDEPRDEDLITCAKCVKSYHLTCHIPNVHKYQQHTNDWKCNKCTLPILGNGNLAVQAIREIIGDDAATHTNSHVLKVGVAVEKPQQNVNIAAAAEEAQQKNHAAVKRSHQESSTSTSNDSNSRNAATSIIVNDSKKIEASKKPMLEEATSPVRFSPNEPIEVPDVKYWSVDQVTEFFGKYFPNEAYVFKEHEIDGMSLLLLKRSDVIKKLPIKLGPSLRIYSLILKIQTQINDPTLGWNCGM